MRLEPDELTAINAAAAHAFGPTRDRPALRQQGDDRRNGGDIDLHVEVDPDVNAWRGEVPLRAMICSLASSRDASTSSSARRGTADSGIDMIARRDGITL